MGAFEYPYHSDSPLQLTFLNTPTTGEPGETVVWDYIVENTGTEHVSFDGWIAVSGPNNSIRDAIMDVTIAPGDIYSGNIYLFIPPNAPLGFYTARGYIGILHQEIWDGEVFDGEVIEGDRSIPDRFPSDDWKLLVR